MEIIQAEPQQKTSRKRNWKGAFSKRRKIIILTGMFVLLVVTGWLNFSLNNRTPEVGGGGQVTNQTAFQMFRNTRHTERQTQLAILANMAQNPAVSPEERESASEQRRLLLEAIEFETNAEGLILMKGFEDVAVTKTRGNVNVMIKTPVNLTEPQVASIQSTLNNVAGRTLPIDNMFINIIS